MVLLLMLVMAISAQAAPKLSRSTVTLQRTASPRNASFTKFEYFYSPDNDVYISSLSESAYVTSVTSKNNWISLEGFKYPGSSQFSVMIQADPSIKAGTYPVTFKVKDGSKTYSFKLTVKVKKYLDVIKSLKIGNKSYNSALAKSAGFITLKLDKFGSQKITYSCRKGYLGSTFTVIRNGKWSNPYKNGSTVTLKRGDVIALDYRKSSWQKSDSFYVLVK